MTTKPSTSVKSGEMRLSWSSKTRVTGLTISSAISVASSMRHLCSVSQARAFMRASETG